VSSSAAPQSQHQPSSLPDMGAYHITISTGTKVGAGTAEDIHITMTGSEGSFLDVLHNKGGQLFQRGEIDEFDVTAPHDLGDLTSVHVWHSGEGFTSSWYVERITVEQVATGLSWEFNTNDWVRGGQKAGKTFRLGGPSRPSSRSVSRENSSNSLAGNSPTGNPAPRSNAPSAFPPLQRRGGAAGFGDESFDVSSELSSPVGRSGPPGPASVAPRLGRIHDESMSMSFDDDEDEPEEPLRRSGSGAVTRLAGNVPTSMGVVLEEDIEEVEHTLAVGGTMRPQHSLGSRPPSLDLGAVGGAGHGPLSGRSAGPVSSSPHDRLARRSTSGGTRRPALAGDEPLSQSLGASGELPPLGRPPLPPTPTGGGLRTLERVSSTGSGLSNYGGRLSATGSSLDFGESNDLPGLGAEPSGLSGRGSGRRRPLGGVLESEPSRASLDSWDNLSVEGSEKSLSMFAPGGIKPPTAGTSVDYVGTSRKRVSFSEYVEEYQFSPASSGLQSLTEDEVLAAQGLQGGGSPSTSPTRSQPPVEVGYEQMMGSTGPGTSGRDAAAKTPPKSLRPSDPTSPGTFEDVPLAQSSPHEGSAHKHAPNHFKLKIFTADKMNAGLGNTDVHVEILGTSATVRQALPKAKGAFQRGCVDRFSIGSDAGDLGEVLAMKMWHEPAGKGTVLGEARWCLERVEIENRIKGIRYVFINSDRDGWIPKGKRNSVVLKPSIQKIDDSDDLMLVKREIEAQLQSNKALDASDRSTLQGKLSRIGQMLQNLTARARGRA